MRRIQEIQSVYYTLIYCILLHLKRHGKTIHITWNCRIYVWKCTYKRDLFQSYSYAQQVLTSDIWIMWKVWVSLHKRRQIATLWTGSVFVLHSIHNPQQGTHHSSFAKGGGHPLPTQETKILVLGAIVFQSFLKQANLTASESLKPTILHTPWKN